MISIQNNNFINTVLDGFVLNSPFQLEGLREWVDDAYNCQKKHEEIEARAITLFKQFNKLQLSTSSLRYKFKSASAKDKLLKAIFDQSFSHNSHADILAAIKVDSKLKHSYSFLKKACWIQIPKIGAAIFGSAVVKMALSISVFCVSFFAIFLFYGATVVILKDILSRKIIPLAINNFPVLFFKVSNVIVDSALWVNKNKLKFIFHLFLIRLVVRGLPEIPYVTGAVDRLDLTKIFWFTCGFGVETLYFVIAESLKVGLIGWKISTLISLSLNDIANKSEKASLHASKLKAQVVWQNLFVQQGITLST